MTILDEVKSVPGYLSDPAASVVFDNFGDSSIGMSVYFWIDAEKVGFFDAQYQAFTKIKAALDERGIEIPFPIRTVYLHQAGS